MTIAFKKYLLFFLGFFILFLIQQSFLPSFSFLGVSFNLFFLAVFLAVFFIEGKMALIMAVFSGLILDVFSFLPFGIYALTLFLTVFAIKEISKIIKKSDIFSFILLLVCFFAFYGLFLFLSKMLFNLLL